jgi:hypothetical protein
VEVDPKELSLVPLEEPTSFAEANKDSSWHAVMEDEKRLILDNGT